MPNIFNNHNDYRSLFIIALSYIVLFTPFFIKLEGMNVICWIIISGFMSFVAHIINHNHQHLPIFNKTILNNFLSILLTILRGHSSSSIKLTHNFNHHNYMGTTKDWIRPELAGKGFGLVRLFRFIINSIQEMSIGKKFNEKSFFKGMHWSQLIFEKALVLIFFISLLTFFPIKTLLFLLLPWMLGTVFIISVNLLQHEDCDSNSIYNHSRNFTSALGNWLLFNNGYHTIHHMHPSLHWSELPKMHKQLVHPHIDPKLEVNSIISYFFNHHCLKL